MAANLVSDAMGNGNEQADQFSIQFEFPNSAPTAIMLSNSQIAENNAVGDLIGTLTSTDADSEDSFTYSLVTGTGDTDNASFTINGDQLLAAVAFDFESQNGFDIRIQTEDGNGGTFAQSLSINIDNVAEPLLRVVADFDIATTALGLTTPFEVTLHNDGDGPLQVTEITYPDGFSGPASTDIGAGSFETLTMFFSPLEEKVYNGDIAFQTNAGNTQVNVQAQGSIINGADDEIIDPDEVTIYPNPASQVLTIELTSLAHLPANIQMFQHSGRLAFQKQSHRGKTLQLDISSFKEGLYLIQISNHNSSLTKKIIIRR